MFFCRIGLVFVVNDKEIADASQDIGVMLLRAFNYIFKHDSPVKAISFLTDVGPQYLFFSISTRVAFVLLGFCISPMMFELASSCPQVRDQLLLLSIHCTISLSAIFTPIGSGEPSLSSRWG